MPLKANTISNSSFNVGLVKVTHSPARMINVKCAALWEKKAVILVINGLLAESNVCKKDRVSLNLTAYEVKSF